MKGLLLLFLMFAVLASCKKDTPLPYIVEPVEDTAKYEGTYVGWLHKHSAGVDSFGVYKTDTGYTYSIDISEKLIGFISIHGADNAKDIPVNDSGYFAFNEFNHNIEGNFKGDSLYLFTEAISGSFDPPQFYDNTQISFAGKKVE